MTPRPRLVASTLLAAALVVASCGSDESSDADTEAEVEATTDGPDASVEPAENSTPVDAAASVEQLTIAISGDEGSLNPYTYVTGYPGLNLLGLVYDGLLSLDTDNEPQPALASEWTVSDDNLVWSLNLRDDVTWHDGEAFDADDVAFTFDYVAENTQSSWTPGVAAVESVEVTSPTSVEITLTDPSADFAIRPLASMPILPEHIWSNVTEPDSSGIDVSIGTGPYSLASYDVDQSYELEANPGYALGTPVADQVLLAVIPEPATAFAALRAGEVDMVSSIVEPQLVAEFESDADLAVQSGPGFSPTMLNFNDGRAPFDDPEVRRAIGLAIDPQELIDTVLLGTGTPPNPGFLHPDGPLTQNVVTHEFDADAANALLDELGAEAGGDGIRVLDGEPMSFELLVYADNPTRIRSAEIVSEQLDAVGISATVTPLEAETVDAQVWPGFDVNEGRDYDLAMWGWSPPTQLDAGRYASLLHSDPEIGTLNVTGLVDPDLDALLDEMLAAPTSEDRAPLIGEIEERVAELRPFVNLFYQDGAYAYRSSAYDGWVYQNGQGLLGKLSLVAT